METLCEQLCTETRSIVNDNSLRITSDIMHTIHNHIGECDRKTYIWIFTHVTALGMQIDEALLGQDPMPGERWAEFISNKLKVH